MPKCKEYVFDRISKEIVNAKNIFEVDRCNGCFVKSSIDDLKNEINNCF
jgi:phage tail tube protein FII